MAGPLRGDYALPRVAPLRPWGWCPYGPWEANSGRQAPSGTEEGEVAREYSAGWLDGGVGVGGWMYYGLPREETYLR